MIFGKPWTKEEESIVLSYPGGNNLGIQDTLKKAGFTRSLEAIQRKKQRLDVVSKPKGTSVYEMGNWNNPKSVAFIPVYTPKQKKVNWISGKLPLLEDRPTKFVMLNDIHIPDNIPLDPVFACIKDYKPDYVILNGDIIDCESFSAWDRDVPGKFKKMPEPKASYENSNEVFFKPLRELIGTKCKIVYLKGNHEDRADRAILQFPEGKGYWETENNIECIDYWVQNKGIINLGKLHFLHGDILKSNVNCSKRMVNTFRRSIRFGHFHTLEETSQTDPLDMNDRHTARCCGTLQNLEPSYMKGLPHNWMHCITLGVVMPDGTFWDQTVNVVKGQIYFNGKFYK